MEECSVCNDLNLEAVELIFRHGLRVPLSHFPPSHLPTHYSPPEEIKVNNPSPSADPHIHHSSSHPFDRFQCDRVSPIAQFFRNLPNFKISIKTFFFHLILCRF